MIGQGTVAIVTGGSAGIGRGIAATLAAHGAAVVVVARGAQRVDEAVAAIGAAGGVARGLVADVAVESDVVGLFREVDAEVGDVDILVNAAGVFRGGPIDEIDFEEWNRVIAVNLTGAFLCTREAMRRMRPRRGGRILNVGSISARTPRLHSAPYTASKAGLVGLTRASALDGRADGVSVGCLHPGNVLTEMRRDSNEPMNDEPMMTVDDVARVAMVMLTADPGVNVLEVVALPVGQDYLGRG